MSEDKVNLSGQEYWQQKYSLFRKKLKLFINTYGTNVTTNNIGSSFWVTQGGEKYLWDPIGIKHTIERSSCFPNTSQMPNEIDWTNTRIVQSSVNDDNILVLTDKRMLYRFRLCCNESYTLIITGKIDTKGSDDVELKISGIACGKSSSVFITRDGKIYECTDTNTDFYGPLIQSKLLPLSQKIIVKVVAGFDHILALTAKGKVYGWGANIHGQLNFNRNCGQAGRLESPSEINIPNVRKVSDIAAMKFMSAVKSSDDGLIYIQGCLQGKKIKRFAVCEYTNIFDGQNSSFYLRKENYTDEEKDIMDDLRNAFFNSYFLSLKSTSDLTIQVDGQSIYVHKSILKMRSSYFKNMFAFNEMQNRQRVIKYGDYSYDVYRNFFRFLYTGCVFYTCSKEMTELLKLSDQYCEINLEEKCIKKLKKNMNSSNVSYIKEIAIKYNKRELEEYCDMYQLSRDAHNPKRKFDEV
ncbi:PREDICTED: RCC1 and BTB domain-containing protein 1-like [Trachymyrmex cornetzi]|uniref:RCC1 and BTB domain-containing protein 1-like n=1 Tax=Trachymyrmex cornetzi TaxID=471704 RepID=UPI00084F720C|nr:PREDICTED: RCC1 and BTB domain-containing protein 1-like [Trachymyrmex cornetzi]